MKIKNLINWSKQNLFSSVFNSLISLFCIYLIIISLAPFIDWAFLSATFEGKLKTDCKTSGACWVFVKVWFEKFMYGFYPVENIWRINLSFLILILSIAASFFVKDKFKIYISPKLKKNNRDKAMEIMEVLLQPVDIVADTKQTIQN